MTQAQAPAVPRLVAVPLDDRPVNCQALAQLGAVAGVRVSLPPRSLLGRFRKPGDPDRLLAWLARELPGADGAVLSLDMLCYGGLVASRSDAVSLEQALARVASLESILKAARVPAAAFSVLLRQSTTVTDAASLARWRRLFELMGLPDDQRAAALAGEGDPAMVAEIARHLTCRKRNHAVNRALLEMAARSTLSYAAILKEDCSPEGVHRLEEAELLGHRAKLSVEACSSLEPGADEGGMMLLARLALAAFKMVPGVAVEFTPTRLSDVVPLYEDRALGRTVGAQVPVCGFVARGDADVRLSVISAAPTGRDLFVAAPHGTGAEPRGWPPPSEIVARLMQGTAARWPVEVVRVPSGTAPRAPASREPRGVAAALAYGMHPAGDRPGPAGAWGIADVGVANGADPELARELLNTGLARWAGAYAGWNTAANTCGSALAHLAALSCPSLSAAHRRARAKAQARYLLTRWIDDYVYQGILRREVLDEAKAAGANPYAFGTAARAIEARLAAEMREAAPEHLGRLFASPLHAPGGPVRLKRAPIVHARLPWNRAFECEIRLEGIDVREA